MTIKRCYPVLVGASVAENQLVQSGATSVTVQSGHKYYAKINGTESLGASTGSAITINDSAKDMVVDLTQKLGSAIADYIYSLGSTNGISKLREWGFLRGYQAYNAGSLESVEVTGKKIVGFNCWNGETDNLRKNIGADGNLVNNNAYVTSDYISVLPNTNYYAKNVGPSANVRTCYLYDSEKNPLSAVGISGASGIPVSGTITTTDKTRYVRLVRFIDQTEFCFNLSSDRNGEYEPYTTISYPLGTDTLRGIFKLDANNKLYADGDRKEADGTITRRYGLLDLGSLNWTKTTASNIDVGYYYQAGLTLSVSGSLNCMLDNYVFLDKIGLSANVAAYGSGLDKVAFRSSNKNIYIIDSAYTDATAFKTAMNGVMLVYELATPTTEQSTPFTSPQLVYPDGTEEFVTETGVPVGHESKYQL